MKRKKWICLGMALALVCANFNEGIFYAQEAETQERELWDKYENKNFKGEILNITGYQEDTLEAAADSDVTKYQENEPEVAELKETVRAIEELECFYDVAEDGTVTVTEKSGKISKIKLPVEFGRYRKFRISEAFSGCAGLRSMIVPEGEDDFYIFNCSNLTNIHLPSSVKSVIIRNCSSLTELRIPEGVERVEITDCTSLRKLMLPSSIKMIGEKFFQGCSSLTEINIPEGISEIGKQAFYGCSSLQSIKLPSSVAEIGEEAFRDCSNLAEINIPEGVPEIKMGTFQDCSSLRRIDLPDSVTIIGMWAFSNCSSLTDVHLSENMVSLPYRGFEYCSSLKNINIPKGVTIIADNIFMGCSSLNNVVIPDNVTTIGNWAFRECKSLTDITIPSSVTEIGEAAFADCVSLDSIVIPDNVVSIGGSIFSGCTNLTDITLSNNITKIATWAFQNCSSLRSIDIPDNVEDMSASYANCFVGCNNLIEINVAENNKRYTSVDGVVYDKQKTTLEFYPYGKSGEISFSDSVTEIGDGAFYGNKTLNSYTIPNQIETIGDSAFAESSLNSVVIPGNVKKIGMSAFANSKLTEIVIPESLPEINWYAFQDCKSLKKAVLPEGMLSIPVYMFWGCSSLTDVNIPNSVTRILDGAFDGCDSLKSVFIPQNVKTINWSFVRCRNLEEINVAEENAYYTSEDGILYDKEKKKLYCCPGGKKGEVVIPDSVTTLEEGAFLITALTNIVIPNSVQVIRDIAFYRSINLETIVIPSSVTEIGESAFAFSDSLSFITIPSNVTKFGDFIFQNCPNLKSVTIQEGVVSGGMAPFAECASLARATVSPGAEGWFGDVKIEDLYYTGTREQFHSRMGECANIANIHYDVLPGAEEPYEKCDYKYIVSSGSVEILKYLGTDKKVIIPSEIGGKPVVKIANAAFDRCANLTNICIPEGVTEIGETTFNYCWSLEGITIPVSMTKITTGMFSNCCNLKDIYYTGNREQFSKLLDNFEEDKFSRTGIDFHYEVIPGTEKPYEKGDYKYISDGPLAEITGYQGTGGDIVIPSEIGGKKVVRIGDRAFAECKTLTSVKFPESLTSIGESAFNSCSGLTEITIPGNIEKIEDGMFVLCTSLRKVIIEEGVKSIGKDVFGSCGKALVSVTIPESVTSIEGENVFAYCGNVTIYGKAGSYAENYAVQHNIKFVAFGEGSRKRISDCQITVTPESFVFDGKAKKPTVIIKDGNMILAEEIDYTVVYQNNINIGIAKAVITGTGNYTGTVTKEFMIVKAGAKKISECTIIISPTSYNYDGTAKKPTVVVRDGKITLKEGTDYVVTYKNNIKVGTAKVIVTGAGNYTGTVAKEFAIIKNEVYTVGSLQYTIEKSAATVVGIKDKKLTKIKIPKTVKIEGKSYKVTVIGRNAFKNNKKVMSVEAGDNVKTIGASAFEGCTKLNKVKFGKGITKIDNKAFKNCKKITEIKIGNKVKYIGTSAFEGCAKLSKITVGNGVTEVGNSAFKNCKKLGTIIIKSSKLTKVGKNALKGIKSNAKIKVPARKLSAYKKLLKNKGQGKKVKIIK